MCKTSFLFLDGKNGVSDINYNNTSGKPEKQKSPQSFFSQKFGAATEGEEAPQVKVRLNPGQEDELTVWGYRQHLGRLVATPMLVMVFRDNEGASSQPMPLTHSH